jgi:hypothetical protein
VGSGAELAGLGASLRPGPAGLIVQARTKVREVPLDYAYPALFDWLAIRRRIPTVSTRSSLSQEGVAIFQAVYRACQWIDRRVETAYPLHPHRRV